MTEAQRPVAIFGATGTVGTELLGRALAAGHRVRALVRRPAAVAAASVELDVVPGDVRDPGAVAETLVGCSAVLSTLGAGRGDDPATRCVGTGNILDAMRADGIRRVVVMGGFHLRLPGEEGNLGQKLVVPLLKLAPGVDYGDTEGLATTVVDSDRDWTLVRSPRVVPKKRAGAYRTGILRLGPWSSVAPGDVADFMLRCLDDEEQVGQAPMICA